MKQCPYCSREIRDDASYCIFCMHELGERTEMRPKAVPGRTVRTAVTVTAAVLAALTALLLIILIRPQKTVAFTLPELSDFRTALEAVVSEQTPDLWDPAELSPATPAELPGADVLTSQNLAWFQGEAEGLGEPFRIAYSAEDGQASLCFPAVSDRPSSPLESQTDYDMALCVAESFLSAAFMRYVTGLLDDLRLSDERWESETIDAEAVLTRYFKPEPDSLCTIKIVRTKEQPDGGFSLGFYLYPESGS